MLHCSLPVTCLTTDADNKIFDFVPYQSNKLHVTGPRDTITTNKQHFVSYTQGTRHADYKSDRNENYDN